ncbi:hypothetical protein MIND_00027700 [Mycena indigotica]|uniref:Nonribosomal peptide synthetase 12 n=1 Tax=Mycena indigotica TaxID=2126181 RepID=A0A8H6WDX5_9AGAR|nr:uncharacterized protein MIND_00027700 [Mycena indigotica]KAF7315134.1 hypothetical protein MIND_00027700 [Mycena indigotica]
MRHILPQWGLSNLGVDDMETRVHSEFLSRCDFPLPNDFLSVQAASEYLYRRAARFVLCCCPAMSTPDHDLEKGLALTPMSEFSSGSQKSDASTAALVPVLSKKSPPPLALPHRTKRKISRMIRFSLWFNTYRKLFTFVVSANLVALILAAIGTWQYPRRYSGAMVLGNLQMAILMRNELFGRFLYLIVNTLFAKARLATAMVPFSLHIVAPASWWYSFWMRDLRSSLARFSDFPPLHRSAKVPSINLSHGRGNSARNWRLNRVRIPLDPGSPPQFDLNFLPSIFEGYHRLVGWFGLISTWIFVILGDSYDIATHSWNPSGLHDIRQQDFWFVIVMTIFTLIPWVTLRKVPVVVEIPSPKVAIIRFERGMQQGLLARISRGAILEFHAFGIISKGRQSGEHYLICGVQGDFTARLVQDPPTHLWTRQLKFAGVSNTSTLYKRGIRVCTGTGLGAALSTCLQASNPNWHLIWMGSSQEQTFGKTISGLIRDNLPPEQYTLWDSKERGGRPDVMELIKTTYVSWGAEVVFITSNLGGNTEMMEGCKQEGIPAFGTLWDF